MSALVAAWRAACCDTGAPARPLVFNDPAATVSAVVEAADRPAAMVDTSKIDRLVAAAIGAEGSSPTLAVRQLLALGRVTRLWLHAEHGSVPSGGPPTLVALDRVIEAAASAALDELERATWLDPLTGLLNRRALDRDIEQQLAAASRHDRWLTVVMVDVEGLKAVNDLEGHAAGDTTLRSVAFALADSLRSGDNAYRIGGDEFVLVLPGLSPSHVDGVMARTTSDTRAAFTWGCAWVRGREAAANEPHRPARLLELADQRMLAFRDARRRTQTRRRRNGRGDSTDGPAVALAGRLSARKEPDAHPSIVELRRRQSAGSASPNT